MLKWDEKIHLNTSLTIHVENNGVIPGTLFLVYKKREYTSRCSVSDNNGSIEVGGVGHEGDERLEVRGDGD